MSWYLPKLLLSVGELALAPVSARSLLFPAAAEFRFVETQLPVVCAWTVAIWGGVLGNGGGRGSQSAVVRRAASIWARVLGLDLPGHQLCGGEFARCVVLRWVELVCKQGERSAIKSGLRIDSLGKLEVIGEELQRSSLTERSGVRRRMLVRRAEWLSLYSGNSRILWHNHVVQLLSVSGGESWYGVCEIGWAGHDILKPLIEVTCGLRLTEWCICRPVCHTRLNEDVPGELPLGSVIIDLEILLVTAGEGGEGGLIAVRPILAVE